MMTRIAVCAVALALSALEALGQPANAPRLDAVGDPLPPGAVARLGTVRFKHYGAKANIGYPFSASVGNVSITANGKFIATVGQRDRRLILWDAATGKEAPGPWNSILALVSNGSATFSPDGSWLAAFMAPSPLGNVYREHVKIWNIAKSKLALTLDVQKNGAKTRAAGFFSDGTVAMVAQFEEKILNVRWFDSSNGKKVREWQSADIELGVRSDFVLGPTCLSVRTMTGVDSKASQVEHVTIVDLQSGKDCGRIVYEAKISLLYDQPSVLVQFSADGKRFAILPEPGAIELRDTTSGKLLQRMDVQPVRKTAKIRDVRLSSDGKVAAIMGEYGNVSVWSEAQPGVLRDLDFESGYWAFGLAFSPDAKVLIAGVGADIRLYDIATLKEVRNWEGNREAVGAVEFSEEGRFIRTSSALRGRRLEDLITWETGTWKMTKMSPRREQLKAGVGMVSPDHTVYLGKAPENQLNLYQMGADKLLARLSMPGRQLPRSDGFFSPDGKFFVLPSNVDDDGMLLYSMPSGKFVCTLPLPERLAAQHAFDPATAPHTGMPVTFSGDGRTAALFAGKNRQICIVDITTGSISHSFELAKRTVDARLALQGSTDLALSHNGKWLASWRQAEMEIRIWEVATGKSTLIPLGDELQLAYVKLAWSPDSSTLAISHNGRVGLWEAATCRLRKDFVGHLGEVLTMAFSPDGHFLATGSADTTVLVWDVRKP